MLMSKTGHRFEESQDLLHIPILAPITFKSWHCSGQDKDNFEKL